MGNKWSKQRQQTVASTATTPGGKVALRPKKLRANAAERPASSIHGTAMKFAPSAVSQHPQQLHRRPLSMQSVPSSTMHSDTRLVINQLCSKRPKYSLLKQIDLDQLDDQIQFLLFESVCDLLDQLGTIERLSAERKAAASNGRNVDAGSDGDGLERLVASYQRLASTFMVGVAPGLLLLTNYRADELYNSVHRVLHKMMVRAAKLRTRKTDALVQLLLDNGCRGGESTVSAATEALSREAEDLLSRTAASCRPGWADLLTSKGVQLLLPFFDADSDVDKCAGEFLDACAAWCWRVVCSPHRLTVRVDSFSPSHPLAFDPALHRTILGPECNPGVDIDCVLWPALCHDGGAVLCKALVKLC